MIIRYNIAITIFLLYLTGYACAKGQQASQTTSVSDWINIQNRGASKIITEDSFIKPFNTDSHDFFGWSIAVSGETIVVGAPIEGSDTTGVNTSDGSDNNRVSGAAYVFVRENDTWVQQAYLKPQYTNDALEFGTSVDISGNTIVIGAPGDNRAATGVNSVPINFEELTSGAVYVFVRNGNTWTQQADFKASNTYIGSSFGHSVAIDNNTIIVGAYGEPSDGSSQNDISTPDAGAAYIFNRMGNTWMQQAYLKPSIIDVENRFGLSVAVSGDTAVVGAAYEEGSDGSINPNAIVDAGAAYVFKRTDTSWTEQARLEPSLINNGDNFGFSCGVSGDAIMVGARHFDGSSINAGRVFVFDRVNNIWDQSQILSSNNGGNFGWAMDMDGDLAIVGARGETVNTVTEIENGAIYTYQKIAGTWQRQKVLRVSSKTKMTIF